jgi:hypothetical protein
MKILLGLFAILSAAPYNNDLPPPKYQGNAVPTIVVTVTNPNSKQACGVAQKGWIILACEYEKNGVPTILAPNPCSFPEANDKNSYAHLMCHEFGHVNGWNNDHSN